MSRSIVQDWVQNLGLRYQGVLMTAVRGGDGIPKEHVTKTLQRAIRRYVLVPYDPRELAIKGGFMSCDPEEIYPAAKALKKELDQLNVHYVFHLLHALEVLGYKHPDPVVRNEFLQAYFVLVRKFHLNPETEQQLHARMEEDRMANNSVAD